VEKRKYVGIKYKYNISVPLLLHISMYENSAKLGCGMKNQSEQHIRKGIEW